MGERRSKEPQKEGEKKADRVNLRFTKDERIRRRNDFIRVYAEGSRFSSPEFTGLYLQTGNSLSRLGMSVGKGVGGSVVRNRLKRRIREIYRLHKHELKPGYDVVIVPRKGCDKKSYAELEKALMAFLNRNIGRE